MSINVYYKNVLKMYKIFEDRKLFYVADPEMQSEQFTTFSSNTVEQ
jgi:chloramphenicol O-acetyltransferase